MILQPGFTLCFTGDRNAPNKPADYTGAFLPECLAFMKLHVIDAVKNHLKVNLGNVEPKRKEEVLSFIERRSIEEGRGPNTLAIFCHGLQNKIQLGFSKFNVDELSKLLRKLHGPAEDKITILLYCCSTANGGLGGDGGFADSLRDSLCGHGFTNCRVMAHVVSGHTTKNPTKRLFEGLGSNVGGTGGIYILKPGTSLFPKWRAKLANTDLRFRCGFMSIAEIHAELV